MYIHEDNMKNDIEITVNSKKKRRVWDPGASSAFPKSVCEPIISTSTWLTVRNSSRDCQLKEHRKS
jgi:hypothetical protein